MNPGVRELAAALCVPADHPSLPGHFPGSPVVPGVVLLDRVAACLQQAGAGRLRRLVAVKFLAPLLPAQHAEIRIAIDGMRARFRIVRDDTTLVSGEAELE